MGHLVWAFVGGMAGAGAVATAGYPNHEFVLLGAGAAVGALLVVVISRFLRAIANVPDGRDHQEE